MNRLFRLYNQNRRTFWIAVGVIIAVIAMVRTLNNYAKEVKKAEDKSSSSNTTTYSAIYDNPNYSVITDTQVSEKKVNQIENTIVNLVNYCNMKDSVNAYNMLSSDCKKNLYKTEEEFKNKYLNVYFKTTKQVNYQAWISEKDKTVYRIEFQEDLLATGGSSNKTIEDYFTIVNENGGNKLNINKYIEHVELNKEVFQHNVKITAVSKDVFLEYVKYNFKIENYTENDILLHGEGTNNEILLVDSNDLKYTAATWENITGEFIVKTKTTKNMEIKFLREYKPEFIEKEIEFNHVNLNYGKGTNKTAIKLKLD